MRSLLTLILLIGITGCSQAVKDLKTPEGTMAEGNRLMEEEFFDEARKQFTRIKTEFPASDKQVDADLKIAETYFEEETYKTAAAAYSEFLKTYPGHPQISYVLYKMGLSYTKQMPDIAARDSRSTHKAIDTFTRLMIDYPNNKYSEEVTEWIDRAQDQLAEKVFVIADFYERQKKPEAAARRFAEVVENHADSRFAEEAFARRVKNLKKAGKAEEAGPLEKSFVEKYPNSKFNLE